MLGRVFVLALGLAVAVPVSADSQPAALVPRGDVGGLWFSADNDGQGLQVDVLDGGRAAITWYSYDGNGAPLWLFGLGRIEGTRIVADLSTASGGRFATQSRTAPSFAAAGRLNISFVDCLNAQLDWQSSRSGLPSGQVALQRLSSPAGTRCNEQSEFAETRHFHFEHGFGGFAPLFADLPPNQDEFHELDARHEHLPGPLAWQRGLRLHGHNHSDDLAMLIHAPISGLQPNTLYALELDAEFATEIGRNCVGIGGSPGESVYLKLGAVDKAPQALPESGGDGWLRLNFDYGVQSSSGRDALVVGDMTNSRECGVDESRWELKRVSTRGQTLLQRSDTAGRLWLVAGTDSAFEGASELYFTSLTARLRVVEE